MKKLTSNIGIIGPMGSGKSFLAKRLAAQLPRVLIYDPLHDSEWPGKTVVGNPREMARLASWRGPWKIHYCATDINHKPGHAVDAPGLDYCASVCWQAQNCNLFIDEAHIVCSPWTTPEFFLKLIRLGRNHRVSILWISHSFSGVSRTLSFNATNLIFFRIREPRDLDNIENRCGKEVRTAIEGLRRNSDQAPPERLEFSVTTGEYRVLSDRA